MTRKYTNKLLQMIEDGEISKDLVINACLLYMSEDDVKDMCISNEFVCAEDMEEYRDEWPLDLLDCELFQLNVGASLYSDADECYVEVKSLAQSDIDAVRKILERMNFEIETEHECEGSDYPAYYFFLK